MSAIFKARKIPKHLIIQEESYRSRRSGNLLWKLFAWGLVLALLGSLLLSYLSQQP